MLKSQFAVPSIGVVAESCIVRVSCVRNSLQCNSKSHTHTDARAVPFRAVPFLPKPSATKFSQARSLTRNTRSTFTRFAFQPTCVPSLVSLHSSSFRVRLKMSTTEVPVSRAASHAACIDEKTSQRKKRNVNASVKASIPTEYVYTDFKSNLSPSQVQIQSRNTPTYYSSLHRPECIK